jgi:hypothetical protein
MNDSLLAMSESRECGRRRVAAAVSAASHSRCHADLPSHLNTAASTRATLSRIQYAELANRAGNPPSFRKGTCILTSNREPRSVVV